MPPRPRHSRISKLREMRRDLFRRRRAGLGALASGSFAGSTVSVARFIAIRQRGQSPAGAFGRQRRAALADKLGFDVVAHARYLPVAGRLLHGAIVSLPGQGVGQMAHFRVQIRAVGQGLGDLLAIDLAETLAQPMHRHARRAFADAQPRRDGRVINRPACGPSDTLEHGKVAGLARGGELGPQPLHRQFQQRERPLAVEDLVRRRGERRIGGVAALGEGGVQSAREPVRRRASGRMHAAIPWP